MSEAQGINFTSPDPLLHAPAKVRWRFDAAATVVALASALIFIIVAIFVFLCFQGYATTIQQAHDRAQSAADVVQEESEWMIGAARVVLQHITSGAVSPADIDQAEYDGAVRDLPVRATLAIYDSKGAAAPGKASASLPQDVSGEDFFKTIAGGGEWSISAQRPDAANGDAIFVLARRLGGAANFGGIAALTISGDVLEEFWTPQKLGPTSTVGLLRDDGWLVARYPAVDKTVNSAAQPLFTELKGQESGTYDSARSPVDGIARVVGFHRIPKFGLIAVASVSQDEILAGLWNSIIIVSWLIAPIALALLVGSLITAGLLRRSARTQASLAAALASNDVLFREIHHRVKNNLQSVASLLQMQPIPREVKVNMSQRIAAMSAVHEHIYRSNDFAHVRATDYLRTLIENIRAGRPDVTVIENLEDISVDKDAATPLGLILNEVASNAFKHAFSDGRKGVVTVSLTKRENGEGCLTVDDNGVGFDPDAPATGIGRRLVSALTQQLGGQSGFSRSSSGGSRFTLTFPLGPR